MEKGVKFEIIDVATDRAAAMEMVQKTGQMGVPVVEIDGKYIIGFDRGAIDEALGLEQ